MVVKSLQFVDLVFRLFSSVGVQAHSEASGISDEPEKNSAVSVPTKKPLSLFNSHLNSSRVSSEQPQRKNSVFHIYSPLIDERLFHNSIHFTPYYSF